MPMRVKRKASQRAAAALDQAMAIEDGMDGAFGRNPNVAVEPSQEKLADLARTPVRLLLYRTKKWSSLKA
jgi:hypothetical protein